MSNQDGVRGLELIVIICSNSHNPKLLAELSATGTRKVVQVKDDITLNLTSTLVKDEAAIYFTESVQEGLNLLEEYSSLANMLEDIGSNSVVCVGGGLFMIDSLPKSIQATLDDGSVDIFVSPRIAQCHRDIVHPSGNDRVRAS